VDKLVARLLATAALWVRIQISLRNTKWALEVANALQPAKKYAKKDRGQDRTVDSKHDLSSTLRKIF
jgi:hypothetical protein